MKLEQSIWENYRTYRVDHSKENFMEHCNNQMIKY